jgi:hypothetical protein
MTSGKLPAAFAENIERVKQGEKPLNRAEMAARDSKPKTVKKRPSKKKIIRKEVTT